MEKVYAVEFMEYTNYSRDTISNGEREIKNIEHIHVGKDPFLVRESELEKYMKWGGGFRTVKFVGNLPK